MFEAASNVWIVNGSMRQCPRRIDYTGISADPNRHREHVFCDYNSGTHHDAYGTMRRSATEKIVVYHGTDQDELYGLTADPDEFTNL